VFLLGAAASRRNTYVHSFELTFIGYI